MNPNQLFDAEMAKRHPIQILLVDDNAINLKVASRMLLRMGYEVDQATNGLEAVEAQRSTGYDLIFMDIQMPEMDGVTATKHIINEYSDDERPRIVAVTAHAMKGDRERYLDAGMDGYISKPVRVERLIEEIKETPCKVAVGVLDGGMQSSPAMSINHAPARVSEPSPVDLGIFAEMLGMDMEDAEEMLPELIELFIDDSAEQIVHMRNAINTFNFDLLRNASHKMKGGAASVAAIPLSKHCGKLEKMALDQEILGSKGVLEAAENEFERIKKWFAEHG
ncbi:MAG: response regulator [Chloroflexota bacterium]